MLLVIQLTKQVVLLILLVDSKYTLLYIEKEKKYKGKDCLQQKRNQIHSVLNVSSL